MLHKHVSVFCVQVRDDERTERFVVFSSALPPRDWRTWPESAQSSVTCTGLLRDEEARSELASGGLDAEAVDAHITRARAFKTTTTSNTLSADWVNAIRRTIHAES
jgi:hypothetical protein